MYGVWQVHPGNIPSHMPELDCLLLPLDHPTHQIKAIPIRLEVDVLHLLLRRIGRRQSVVFAEIASAIQGRQA